MGIRIKHEPVAAPIIAAYATGVGAAQERRRKDAMRLWQENQQMRWRTQMAMQENQWANQRQQAGFGQQQALQINEQNWRDKEAEENRGFQAEQQEREWGFRQDDRQEWRDMQGLKAGTHYYTPQQEKDISNLDTLIGDLQSGKLQTQTGVPISPLERDAFLSEAERARREIRPVPKPANQQPSTLGEQFQNDIHIPEEGPFKGVPLQKTPAAGGGYKWEPIQLPGAKEEGAQQKDQATAERTRVGKRTDYILKEITRLQAEGKPFQPEEAKKQFGDFFDSLYPPATPAATAAPTEPAATPPAPQAGQGMPPGGAGQADQGLIEKGWGAETTYTRDANGNLIPISHQYTRPTDFDQRFPGQDAAPAAAAATPQVAATQQAPAAGQPFISSQMLDTWSVRMPEWKSDGTIDRVKALASKPFASLSEEDKAFLWDKYRRATMAGLPQG